MSCGSLMIYTRVRPDFDLACQKRESAVPSGFPCANPGRWAAPLPASPPLSATSAAPWPPLSAPTHGAAGRGAEAPMVLTRRKMPGEPDGGPGEEGDDLLEFVAGAKRHAGPCDPGLPGLLSRSPA